MKEITLTQGKVALVDDKDYEWLMQYNWCAYRSRHTYYAHRRIKGTKINMKMHREILGLISGDGKETDHKNRNGLDNQRNNLRIATRSLNRHNCNTYSNNSSGLRGVIWYKPSRKWRSQITINGKFISLGYFNDPVEAALTYDRNAIKFRGNNAILNFPDSTGP